MREKKTLTGAARPGTGSGAFMLVIAAILSFALALPAAAATQVVVPSANATAEANINNIVPFSGGFHAEPHGTTRYQQVYSAEDFAAAGHTFRITKIAFRLDGSDAPYAESATIPDISIYLSTTSKAVDGLSSTFADNLGADNTLVYSGSLSFSVPYDASVPRPFDVVVTLQTPFVYTPADGNLLMEVRNVSGVTSGVLAALDASSLSSDGTSRVWNTSSADAATGGPDTYGLVTQFTTVPYRGWAVVANDGDADILTYDLNTDPPTQYGPFLQGQLGPGGALLEVAVAPNDRTALLSSFDSDTVYRVDLSDPADPVAECSLAIPFHPEHIAFAPDGSYAMVTDGGSANRIAVIDMTDFTLKTTYTLQAASGTADSVAIAPDNQTWVAADIINNRIIYGTYSLASGFSSEHTLPAGNAPVNVAISPDGQTVLVANGSDTQVSVYRITAPGALTAEPAVTGLPFACQSIVFSPDGSRAYVLSDTSPYSQLSWLSVTGPGVVSLGGAGVASLLPANGYVYFGVDQLAISKDGQTLVAANPDGSNTKNIALVDTSTFSVAIVGTGSLVPRSVATFLSSGCPSISVVSSPSSLPDPVAGSSYGPYAFTASGGTGPYTYALACDSGPLPPGMTLGPDGSISGTPTHSGPYTFTVVARDSDGCPGRATFTLTVDCPPLSVEPSSVPGATASEPYTQSFSVLGGSGAYTFGQTGSLPDGLSFSGNTLSGTPTQTGTFHFTVNAQDTTYGCTTSRNYTLNVACPTIDLSPGTLPAGVDGQTYPSQTFHASAGVAPFSYAILSGTLPGGLTLSPDGTLSGTFSGTGAYSFTVQVTDKNGCTGQRTYTLAVYSSSFYDDGGASVACVDAHTGAFQWTVLSGPYAGMTFTGTLEVYNGGTMYWSQPGASQYVYLYYDPNGHTAWGYVYDFTTGLYSSLYDSNTLNNPIGCGALPAT